MAYSRDDQKTDVDFEVLTPDVEPKMDLDKILVEEIGQFGRYQLRTCLLSVLLVIFAAWGAVEYVFTTSRITTR